MGDEESLAGILNTLRRGVLLLGPNAEVVFANAAAHTLIADADALEMDGSRLLLRPMASQNRLEQYLADQELQAVSLVMPLYRRSGGSALRCVISALDPADLNTSRFLVFVYDVAGGDSIDRALLCQTYQFTATESMIAALLFEGLTIQDIASQLGCSHHTVRVHGRNIFRKCGVHSKAELVRLMALGPRGTACSRCPEDK
jgi:DNA-binding CsgD family transcriptional regulator